MRIYLAPLLLTCSIEAHAGFITGYAVGSSTSSNGTSQTQNGVLLASDKYDVITCEYRDANTCFESVNKRWPSLDEFATFSGYKTIHRKSIFVYGKGNRFHVMEVSK